MRTCSTVSVDGFLTPVKLDAPSIDRQQTQGLSKIVERLSAIGILALISLCAAGLQML